MWSNDLLIILNRTDGDFLNKLAPIKVGLSAVLYSPRLVA